MNSDLLLIVLIVMIVLLVLLLIFSIINMISAKRGIDTITFERELGGLEKSILKDSHENFNRINETNERKLNEIRKANEDKLTLIDRNINEKLDKSLNERLDSSFKTIGEQLQQLQKTNGELISMSGTISDLQKSLSSVKERGIFGEKQLENILQNLMTTNMYECQYKIKGNSDRMVDFAIKIPNKEDDGFVYLPIDSKFPNDKYLAIVNASNTRNEDLVNEAIRDLKDAIMLQAKSISEKYIEPPITTEFAIMFLPTEGLYAECLRIDGLADTLQSKYNVLLAGPTTVTAIINSFSVGFKFLQINKNSKEIAKILQAVKVQYGKFGEEIDKTKRSIEKAAESTESLSKRNQMITNKLKNFETMSIEESNNLLEIDD